MLAGVPQEIVTLPSLPTDADVVFLSSFDGVDTQQSATDRSPVAAHITFVGDAQLGVGAPLFGTASLYMAGTSGEVVRTPRNALYNLVTGNFTVEGFVYFTGTSYPGNGIIACVYSAGGKIAQSQWMFYIQNNNIKFDTFDGGVQHNAVTGVHGMSPFQWYHVAVCRTGSTIRIFVGGVMVGFALYTSPTALPTTTTLGLSIGSDWDGANPGAIFQAHFSEIRLTKAAWYRTDATFTPVTGPFGALVPHLVAHDDVFYSPRINPYGIRSAAIPHDDVIYSPSVSPQTARPSLITDTDTIFAPSVRKATTVTFSSGAAITGSGLILTNTNGTGGGYGLALDGISARLAYWEVTLTHTAGLYSGAGVVLAGGSPSGLINSASNGIQVYTTGDIWKNGVDLGNKLPVLVDGDTIGIAMNATQGQIWFKRVNGAANDWNGVVNGSPVIIVGGITLLFGIQFPSFTFGGTGGTNTENFAINFGQSPFVGTVPTGYPAGWVGDQ